MTIVDITFGRAFRVWWSYAWRAIVLSPVILIPLQILVFTRIVPHVRAAAAGHDHAQMRAVLELVAVAWPIAIVCIIVLQTLAMRWMLRRAHWTGFKLVASSLQGHF
jgi:hypothetical protein